MTARARAAKGKADSCQPDVIRAVKLLGLKYKPLSAAGQGIEDLLVLMPRRPVDVPIPDGIHRISVPASWLFIECKVPRNKAGTITPSQYKPAQIAWRAETPEGPRITCVSLEDALKQLRGLLGK